MYRLEREDFVKSPYISLWALLGFQAGFLNAFGFLACGRFVSHVTGFGTQIGLAFADRRWWFGIELLGIPLSFVLGAFTSGFFTSARLERGLKPGYGWVTAAMPALILALLVAGSAGVFGPFGEDLRYGRDFALLFALSFVCGMQNGCFATLTKGQIRTTHLTGISTDLGTDLARLWFGRLRDEERELTRRTNFSRAATFAGFALGSILCATAGRDFGYSALVLPLATSFVAWSSVRKVGRILDARKRWPRLMQRASSDLRPVRESRESMAI